MTQRPGYSETAIKAQKNIKPHKCATQEKPHKSYEAWSKKIAFIFLIQRMEVSVNSL